MILWIESQPTLMIVVVVLALSYALATVVFVVASLASGSGGAHHVLRATTPSMLTPLSLVTGLLIVFIAQRVWSNFDRAHAFVAQETSAVRDTLLLADELPPDTRTKLRDDLRTYLRFIDTDDWPAMIGGRAGLDRWPPGLTDAMATLIALVPSGPGQAIAQQHAISAVERIVETRRGRILLSRTAIAPIQWIVIVILDALTLLTIAMVHLDRRATIVINLFVFSTAIGCCLALLMVNDRPFSSGGTTIEPATLREISID
jgi:hypothetical protein